MAFKLQDINEMAVKRVNFVRDLSKWLQAYRSLYSQEPRFSHWLCGERQGLVLHEGVSLSLSPEGYVGFSYPSLSVIPLTHPSPTATLTAVQLLSTIWPLS